MIIVVNDANALIDIVKLQLLPQFFDQELEIHTTSLIFNEMHSEHVEQLQKYIGGSRYNVCTIMVNKSTKFQNEKE